MAPSQRMNVNLTRFVTRNFPILKLVEIVRNYINSNGLPSKSVDDEARGEYISKVQISISTNKVLRGEVRIFMEEKVGEVKVARVGMELEENDDGLKDWKNPNTEGIAVIEFRKSEGDPMEWRKFYRLVRDKVKEFTEVIQ
jgi:hypothetical protein